MNLDLEQLQLQTKFILQHLRQRKTGVGSACICLFVVQSAALSDLRTDVLSTFVFPLIGTIVEAHEGRVFQWRPSFGHELRLSLCK